MKMSKNEIAEKFAKGPQNRNLSDAIAFLSCAQTARRPLIVAGRDLEDEPVRVGDIIKTWEARLQNAVRKGILIPGCDDLVHALKNLPQNSKLMCVGFENAHQVGLFWLTFEGLRPVGFVLGRWSSEAMLRPDT